MKKAFIITVSILSCVILVLSLFLYSTNVSLNSTNMNLENLYQRSFYDLVNNVNNMEVEVSKLMVSNDSTSQQKSLSKLKQQSSDAENSLSLLPINENILEKTTRFMNQFNGYCTSLITYKDGKIENEDYETLGNVYNSISNIKTELNKIMEKIMKGYRISDNISGNDVNSDFSLNFSSLSNDTIEYPSLIYDGPFSDSTLKKSIKGLKSTEISENDAENLITKIFDNKITNLNFLGETNSNFVTFDFGVNTEDGKNYFIQITKQGGFLLTISSNVLNDNLGSVSTEVVKDDNSSEEIEITDENNVDESSINKTEESSIVKVESINNLTSEIEKAIDTAENFAKKLGLNDMKCVWSAASEEISYINLAPVIDDIIMYPDLIKVKVDLKNNSLVGWEATSYAYNHTERDDLIPQLSEDEARKLVSSNLDVNSQKLCVIPLDYVGETLAYEFAGKYNDFNYYLYIDAYNGSQVRILKVVQTDEGELVL
ncbi:MAG: germination protein YpeB [Clostridia bacterium]|nr:germination protein YpeB [Clostridia bacterium]